MPLARLEVKKAYPKRLVIFLHEVHVQCGTNPDVINVSFWTRNERVAWWYRQGRVTNPLCFHFYAAILQILSNYEIMELRKYSLQFIFTLVVTVFKAQCRNAHIKDIGLPIFGRINIGLNANKGSFLPRKRRDNPGESCPKLDDAPVRHQVIFVC